MIIYDFDNEPKEVILPEKVIERIFVHILSGDETGTVYFADGTELDFDASDARLISYNDGYYTVEGEAVAKWLSFSPSNVGTYDTISYLRKTAVLRGEIKCTI